MADTSYSFLEAQILTALLIVVFLAALIGCIGCICWKRQIDRRLTNLGLTQEDIQRSINQSERDRVLSVDEADSSYCGWCRYWWGDQTTQTENIPRKSYEMSHDEVEESHDVLCNLETLPASSQGTRSGSICSTSLKTHRDSYKNLRDSPKLSRSSIDRGVSISTGGRRISHDPFTLCQDLQVMETRRKSEIFQQRRKSEQFQLGTRRKSSITTFGPLLERDSKVSKKSFSMEQM